MHTALIIDAKASLGEGSIRDFEKKILYWIDITGKKVYIYDPASQINKSIVVGQMPGTIVPRAKGGLVVALQDGLHFLDETEPLSRIQLPVSGIKMIIFP